MTEPYIYNLGLAFSESAERHASRVALHYPTGEQVTYAALETLSNQTARWLIAADVAPGDVVCIFNRKSPGAFAGMLACLKVGAIYTNLDVTSPAARIEKMMTTCQPALVLLDGDDENDACVPAAFADVRRVALQSEVFRAAIAEHDDGRLDSAARVTGAEPAYIMFTSGSTGVPKGATMTHANVLNFIAWGRSTFDISPADRMTNVNPIYFDNSVFDFYVSLFNGATMCPFPAAWLQQPRELVAAVGDLQCTVWFSVPSMLVYLLTTKALGADDFPAMRVIVFGGEGFPKRKLQTLHKHFGHRVRIVNVYGPTECTCICSAYDISAADFDDLQSLAPLGHLAPNFGYLIDPLDAADAKCGELLLCGPNVGLGYYNDTERTQASFVQDPRGARHRRVCYRTGDLVRETADGKLHFQGRVDHQIKHMGYRIELEEIEGAINSLGFVHEAAVLYDKRSDEIGRIVAFVAVHNGTDESHIRDGVRAIVPPYMVPQRFHLLPSLKKNANGKIDRVGLRELLK